MAKAEFVQLAHDYRGRDLVGRMISEKLDGQRFFWDGGITIGWPKHRVPWGNCAKDERLKVEQISTGLWSRYGNIIHAPASFINRLPRRVLLDGELDSMTLSHQDIESVVRRHTPDDRWSEINPRVFDAPPPFTMFMDRHLTNKNFTKFITGALPLMALCASNCPRPGDGFRQRYQFLIDLCYEITLTQWDVSSQVFADSYVKTIWERGGEGAIVRSATAPYVCQRTHEVEKIKDANDAEATITGFIAGRAGVEGRVLGKLGALVCDFQGHRLELSGMSANDRILPEAVRDSATANPGMPIDIKDTGIFRVGQVVTFRYRDLTNDGIPKEARYWRERTDV